MSRLSFQLVLVCFYYWKKRNVSHRSLGDAVKVFVKHCTTLRFFYVDAFLSWWTSVYSFGCCVRPSDIWHPGNFAFILRRVARTAAKSMDACMLICTLWTQLKGKGKMYRNECFLLIASFYAGISLFIFEHHMWLHIQIKQSTWRRHATNAWDTWNEPESYVLIPSQNENKMASEFALLCIFPLWALFTLCSWSAMLLTMRVWAREVSVMKAVNVFSQV